MGEQELLIHHERDTAAAVVGGQAGFLIGYIII